MCFQVPFILPKKIGGVPLKKFCMMPPNTHTQCPTVSSYHGLAPWNIYYGHSTLRLLGPLPVIFDEQPLLHNEKIGFKNLDFTNKNIQYCERFGDFAKNCSSI